MRVPDGTAHRVTQPDGTLRLTLKVSKGVPIDFNFAISTWLRISDPLFRPDFNFASSNSLHPLLPLDYGREEIS
jgi:hypothetical protein